MVHVADGNVSVHDNVFAMMLVSYYKYMPGVVNEKTTTNGGLKNENTDYERKYQQIDCH